MDEALFHLLGLEHSEGVAKSQGFLVRWDFFNQIRLEILLKIIGVHPLCIWLLLRHSCARPKNLLIDRDILDKA